MHGANIVRSASCFETIPQGMPTLNSMGARLEPPPLGNWAASPPDFAFLALPASFPTEVRFMACPFLDGADQPTLPAYPNFTCPLPLRFLILMSRSR